MDRKNVTLHKINCTLAKQVRLDCTRFVLSFHKINCTLAKQVKLDCALSVLSLHYITNVVFLFCHNPAKGQTNVFICKDYTCGKVKEGRWN